MNKSIPNLVAVTALLLTSLLAVGCSDGIGTSPLASVSAQNAVSPRTVLPPDDVTLTGTVADVNRSDRSFNLRNNPIRVVVNGETRILASDHKTVLRFGVLDVGLSIEVTGEVGKDNVLTAETIVVSVDRKTEISSGL